MLKFFIKSILIVNVLMVCSCNNNKMIRSYYDRSSNRFDPTIKDFKAVENNEKGVALFAITTLKKSKRIGVNYAFMRFISPNKRPEEIDIDKELMYQVNSTESNSILQDDSYNYANLMLFLKPGTYIISRINIPVDDNSFITMAQEGIEDLSIVIGAFEVKAGKVLTLGRLDVTDGKFEFIREDDKIKADLKQAGYGNLIPKMEEGAFYKSGSIWYYYKRNGKVYDYIIPAED